MDTIPIHLSAAVNRDVTYAQWTTLLAHIAHLAEHCAQPHTAQHLKTLGVRRTRTVVIGLAREYVYAWDVADSNGFALSASAVLRIARAMPVNGPLTEEFHALADIYRLLLRAMAPRDGDALFQWLSERASVHVAQAQAVQPVA
ncbi:MAG: hypothetical protein ABI227_08630 [Rhodanobacter sp.]